MIRGGTMLSCSLAVLACSPALAFQRACAGGPHWPHAAGPTSPAALAEPQLVATIHRARTPAMLEAVGSVTDFLASNQKVAAFLAVASAFGISSAFSRMSSPAGEDIVASAVAGERNRFAELPTPSVLSILYAAIIGLAVKDLVTSGVASDWIANGAALSDLPLGTVGGGLVLAALGGSELAKMRPGSPEADYYSDLEGLEVGSLSAQAAEWALAGEVPTTSPDGYAIGTVAGGCFWGTELHFQRVDGVVATAVGYTQGRVDRPTYKQVSSGITGHAEALMIMYDPSVVSYGELCDKLISTVDSTRLNCVGNDFGTQYRHGLYPCTDEQEAEALDAIRREQTRQAQFKGKVVTEVRRASVFWPAERVHQRKLQRGGQSVVKGDTTEVRCYG